MVHLRYRVNSSSEAWTTPTTSINHNQQRRLPDSSRALKSDTEYGVEASFDGNFVNGVLVSKTVQDEAPNRLKRC